MSNRDDKPFSVEDHHGDFFPFDPKGYKRWTSSTGTKAEVLYRGPKDYWVLREMEGDYGRLITVPEVRRWLLRNGHQLPPELIQSSMSTSLDSLRERSHTVNYGLLQKDAGTQRKNARHSPGFRSVSWSGKTYALTAAQAACVKILWEAWEQGTPDVGQDTILAEIESNCSRLRDVFREHAAWREMIVKGNTKGTFRLKEPS